MSESAIHLDRGVFWEKLARSALKAGRSTVELALRLFYAVQSPDTPAWARSVIVGALAYFVLPIDTLPDLLPGVGYVDDLGVLMAAVFTVAAWITPEIKEKARHKMEQWFGPSEPRA